MTPEEKNIYDKMELLRIRVPWDGPGFKKRNVDTINDPYGLAGIPTYPKGMLDDMSLQDIEHTPVDVLMFTSDITPAWYGTVTYPGQAYQTLGSKQFTDRENRAYLRCCLLYTSPSPRDGLLSRMPSSA